MKTASIGKNQNGEHIIIMKFPYDLDMLFNVRTLTGRKWHAEDKCWSAPIYPDTVKCLKEWNFTFDNKLTEYLNKTNSKVKKFEKVKIKGIKGVLYPFQKKGVSFIEANNGRALIADEMGLGKTVQALAWLQLHPELRPAIIVCPASLKLNWVKEALMWMHNPNVEILMGTTPWRPEGDILIINYDILPHWADRLQRSDPKVVIFDEAQYIKSNSAKRTKAAKKLAKGTHAIIGLSGTPIENRPMEMFNIIHMIDPNLFPNQWQYASRYCNAKYNGFGWDFNGASHTEELHEKLIGTVMLRRKKEEVLPDLPAKVRSFVPVQICNLKDYKAAERDVIAFIQEHKGKDAAIKASNAETLAKIEVLKQLAVKGKLKEAIEWIRTFLEVDGKLVVFAIHKFVINELMKEFSDIAVKIDGTINPTQRSEIVERFQQDEKIRLFVGNIKAAGVGLTLTAASNVAFLELPWTPGELSQAEDRCHRIGQKDCVNIYYLLSNTIEERIAQILDSKRKVLDAVLDGIETQTDSLLTELIKEWTTST